MNNTRNLVLLADILLLQNIWTFAICYTILYTYKLKDKLIKELIQWCARALYSNIRYLFWFHLSTNNSKLGLFSIICYLEKTRSSHFHLSRTFFRFLFLTSYYFICLMSLFIPPMFFPSAIVYIDLSTLFLATLWILLTV